MQKEDDEKIVLTEKKTEEQINIPGSPQSSKKKKARKNTKKKGKKRKDDESGDKPDNQSPEKKKSNYSNDQFIINGTYNLIKMLGFGAFGEIHLAYDTNTKVLRAIKFEVASQKNPQLKHEFNILEQLNKSEGNNLKDQEGIPKVYAFDRVENKFNYMVMDFLGPSLSDLFQFKEKTFSIETTLMLGIQMLSRIEYIHEKGFIHRDIKPENFVIGLNEKSNIIHIIDFGLSKRYKDKNSGQHIPYRENRHLVGTVRYASINSHLGIEQSRRDDIESIGYVLIYFHLGRLPWQSKQDKTKAPAKILEKKLNTPPEILCKKMPMEFAYYFHYCKNLKFEDRPDYATLKSYFTDLLLSKIRPDNDFIFDWFEDKNEEQKRKEEKKKDEEVGKGNQFLGVEFRADDKMSSYGKKKSPMINPTQIVPERDEETSMENVNKPNLLNLTHFKSAEMSLKRQGEKETPSDAVLLGAEKKKGMEAAINNNNPISNENDNLIKIKGEESNMIQNIKGNVSSITMKEIGGPSYKGPNVIQLKQSQPMIDSQRSFSERNSSESDTERMEGKGNSDETMKNIARGTLSGRDKNSDSNYHILNKSLSEKSSEDKNMGKIKTDDISLLPSQKIPPKKGAEDVKLNVESAGKKK